MTSNPKHKKWFITINNFLEHGYTRERILQILSMFRLVYFCLCEETTDDGNHHIHIFIIGNSQIHFSTLQKRFVSAHFEKAEGSPASVRDYVRKEGRWQDSDRAHTNMPETFFESGELPTDAQLKACVGAEVIAQLEEGRSAISIIRDNPDLAFRGKSIDELAQYLLAEKYENENREVTVHYYYGDTGAGKTRSVYDKHPKKDVCRITSYGGVNGCRFDAYHGQPVLVLEEFHSQIPVTFMLTLLDIYPLWLPARYNDRIACFTEVYILSNISLDEQYPDLQKEDPETWRAFRRRITSIIEYRRGQEPKEHKNDWENI